MAYGIANRSGQVTISAAKEILMFADKYEIDTVDTAIAYGESEACLGQIGVKQYRVVTKLPPIPDNGSDIQAWIEREVSESLARLKVASLYGLLLHRPLQLLESRGSTIFQALLSLKKLGIAKKIGVSVYSPLELDLLIKKYRFDIVQMPFNLFDRRFLTSGWLQRLRAEEVEVHSRSTFLQGLLLMPISEIPAEFSAWGSLFEKWGSWLKSNSGVSALQASLSYPLSYSEIDRVIVGVDSSFQLMQVLGAALRSEMFTFPDLLCEDEKLVNPSNWLSR